MWKEDKTQQRIDMWKPQDLPRLLRTRLFLTRTESSLSGVSASERVFPVQVRDGWRSIHRTTGPTAQKRRSEVLYATDPFNCPVHLAPGSQWDNELCQSISKAGLEDSCVFSASEEVVVGASCSLAEIELLPRCKTCAESLLAASCRSFKCLGSFRGSL